MSYKLLKSIGLAIVGILMYSCSKDTESFKPYQDTGQVLNLIEKINDQTESIEFSADEDHFLITNDKVIIEYPKNSLVNIDGEIISGNVKLIFNEVVSSGQSIFIGGSTKVNDKLFTSISLLNILFEDLNGNSLRVKENASLTVYHPKDESNVEPQVRMYRAIKESDALIWDEIKDPTANNGLEFTDWNLQTNVGLIFGQGYKYSTSKLGWHALGDYVETDGIETQEICVELPELFNEDNTKVFFVFEDLISIVDLQTFKKDNNAFCGDLINSMDVKNNYIVTLSNTESGDYYLGYSNNPSTTQPLLIEPKKSTIEEISQFLYER